MLSNVEQVQSTDKSNINVLQRHISRFPDSPLLNKQINEPHGWNAI